MVGKVSAEKEVHMEVRVIHMDRNAKGAYYVAGRCVLYVMALKDNEKVELFSTP